ncbi:MAG: acetoin utilization protein AcuC [Candidatus Bathyarchaeia archaeon]
MSALIYDEDLLSYDFGPSHPFRSIRVMLTIELIKALGILKLPNVRVFKPRISTEEEVLLFHEESYVELVKRMSGLGHGLLDMGDTPAFKGCYEASLKVVGASLSAIDLLMSGEAMHAFNPAGGLHHAHPEGASGFCIFNDPAVSIAYLKKDYNIKKIMYLDIDAHHGDGVMYGFYSDPDLLDIDFHEDGRYLFPGTGFLHELGEGKAKGYKINVPLPPHTYDEAFLIAFKEIVPILTKSFKPEIILMQCGIDAHFGDRLAHLGLTTKAYMEAVSIMHELAHEVCDGKLVMFGGGGYTFSNVSRCWTLIFAKASGFSPPDELPKSWIELFKQKVHENAPSKLYDLPQKVQDEDILNEINRIISEVKGASFLSY